MAFWHASSMILLIGSFLWTLTALTTGRVLSIATKTNRKQIAVILLLMALVAGAIFMRPHEDFFGGQDTGAYLNAAATYARHNALSYEDPMLQQISASERFDFLVSKWYVSKYHCLYLPNPQENAVMAPWFQPAFSVLAAFPAFFLPVEVLFFIAPLLALLTTIGLAILAKQLFQSRPLVWRYWPNNCFNHALRCSPPFFFIPSCRSWHGMHDFPGQKSRRPFLS